MIYTKLRTKVLTFPGGYIIYSWLEIRSRRWHSLSQADQQRLEAGRDFRLVSSENGRK